MGCHIRETRCRSQCLAAPISINILDGQQVGPEFLHGGDSSSIKKLVDAMGCRQREYPFPNRYYFGKERKWLPCDSDDPDIERVHEIFGEMAEQDEAAPDESMRTYLERKGVNENVMELAQGEVISPG
jgi:hypothetical protein